MSNNHSKKKHGHFRKGNSHRSETFTKAESTEIMVPKFNIFPISNYHKWNKRILKQIKKEYRPIRDSIVEGKYPNFAEESIKLILASPLDIFREIQIASKAKSSRRLSISTPGRLSFLSSNSSSMQMDSSSDEESAEQAGKGSAARKDYHDDSESSVDIESSSSPASLLKLSSTTPLTSKTRQGKGSKSPPQLTDQQLALINNYISDKQKTINDLELYYMKQLPSVCAYILSTLSPAAETKVRQHQKFDKAYRTDNVIKLMSVIQQCSVLTPLDIPNRANEIRQARTRCYQNNRPLDYFCELFNQFEKDLEELGRPTEEEDLIVIFLNHLHPSYCSIITQWKINDTMPKSIDAVQSKLQQYESLAIAQTINMKSPGGQKPGEAGIQDVAMLSSAHHQGGKQRKGPSPAVQQSQPQYPQ